MDDIREDFWEYFDTIQVISKEAKENLGEDSFFCMNSTHSAIVSVYDGCGGLGSRKYETMGNHSGAYIASRVVSGAVRDWYYDNGHKHWKDAQVLKGEINQYILKGYEKCKKYAVDKSKIMGSMVRSLPTTMAFAYAECDKKEVLIHVLWAGDSRVYMLDDEGLVQVTVDDIDIVDAFENLRCDAPLTNVLSSDGKYEIHCKTLKINKPTIIFAATDGCFGYIPSPMEFEYEIVKSMVQSKNPQLFKKNLCETLAKYAGDDLAFGMMSFYFGDFNTCKKKLHKRLKYLENNYISLIEKDIDEEILINLWGKYKTSYERHLKCEIKGI